MNARVLRNMIADSFVVFVVVRKLLEKVVSKMVAVDVVSNRGIVTGTTRWVKVKVNKHGR